jgi:vanillate O-demethylase ferredoxin subunit
MSLPTPRTVRVASRRDEAGDICSFELVPVDGTPLPPFTAGAHVEVEVPQPGGGVVTRPYSLCNPPVAAGGCVRYQIAVLREPASRGGSAAMHAQVREGTVLSIRGPNNRFELAPQAPHHLLMAGGIGITPLLAMAEALAASGAPFTLHYAARSLARTAFVDRLSRSAFARRVHLHADDGPPAQRLDIPGVIASAPHGSHVYVCGPKGFIDAVIGTARRAGWLDERLHQESFSAEVEVRDTDGPFDVVVVSRGLALTVPRGRTVVEVLAEAGVVVPTSCEQGVCGTCLTRVIEGVPDHRDSYLTPEEQAAGDQFTPCCSRARGPRLVLDL